MRGTIRSTEKVTIEQSAGTTEEARAKAFSQVPSGFEVTRATATIKPGGDLASATVICQSEALQEIEAVTFEGIRSATPDGWQLLNVRI